MFLIHRIMIHVHRSDKITLDEVNHLAPDYILISPGPKDPAHTGISMPLIEARYHTTPILGVCLGMQCINEVFGGQTVRAPLPVHGKTSMIYHERKYIFDGTPSPFSAERYHSLMSRVSRSELEITARSDDGVIMGLSHPEFPLHGVQFHPESFMTEHGPAVINNFLNLGPLRGNL
jgi:anthranilate synthase component 2